MTDELDQAAIGEPEVGEAVGEVQDGMVSADASMAASLPSIRDINLENAEKAAKWGWKKVFGHEDRVVPTEPPVLDLPTDQEETTMRSTWVAHEDPPPPAPDEPQHEAEHATNPEPGAGS